MIKMIKGKGNYKYFCPKCKTTFETNIVELNKCPICEMDDYSFFAFLSTLDKTTTKYIHNGKTNNKGE